MKVGDEAPGFITQAINISACDGTLTVAETENRETVKLSILERGKTAITASNYASVSLSKQQFEALMDTKYRLTVKPGATEPA